MGQSEIATFLFADINSTAPLANTNDEAGQRILAAHHKTMGDILKTFGGERVDWLGDGLLATFGSAADALRCAIAMQQATCRPIAGVRIDIRIGIHASEALRRDGMYFGAPLAIAQGLGDKASAGQIFCSKVITALLASRKSFSFRALGEFDLEGLATPLDIFEVIFQRNDPAALLKRTPFVGRNKQLDRLLEKLENAINERGSVVTLVGEAGIGKTRMIEEFADLAQNQGAQILAGNCYAGEWHQPYCPFVEIITGCANREGAERLSEWVGGETGPILRIAPGLSRLFKSNPEVQTFDVEEERLRMLHALQRLVVGASQRAPLVVILDDLHWADSGTAAMLNHIARSVGSNAILLLGSFRDSEIDRRHPLAPVLESLKLIPNYETIELAGLSTDDVKEMLGTIGAEPAPEPLVQLIGNETNGNPFFIRELLLHLKESGKILTEGKSWLPGLSLEELGIPEGIRELIEQRLEKLSDDARNLMLVGSAFNGTCLFSVAASVAGLDESAALNGLDEAMSAQVLRVGADAENFEFTHAIIRHTLYAGLNPARRVRLHRKIAEAMEGAWGERVKQHAADVAYHFWRAGTPSGANRGVEYAISAADNAESSYAYEEVVAFLRIALELLPASDPRRARIWARLGTALVWTTERDAASKVVFDAGELIAKAEGENAAVDYLEGAAFAMYGAGLRREPWEIAKKALPMIGSRRNVVWASLKELDLMRQEAEDATNPGIRTDSAGQRELRTFLRSLPREQVRTRDFPPPYESRDEVVSDPLATPVALLYLAGDAQGSLPLWRANAVEAEQHGRIARAARYWANVMTCQVALGEFTEAQASRDRSVALGARAIGLSSKFVNMDLMEARHGLRIALDDGWQDAFQDGTSELFFEPKPDQNWAFAITCSNGAYLATRINMPDAAIQLLGMLPRALERGAPWEATYSAVACDAAAVLWYTVRTDFIDVIEKCIREKVLGPDFRWPMRDARLAMGRLCALRQDYEEAVAWFDRARRVLDEQGARPLRSIVDYDEALMYLRRSETGDFQRVSALLGKAADGFGALSMTGWNTRVDEARSSL